MTYLLYLISALAGLFRGLREAICYIDPYDIMHDKEWLNGVDSMLDFDNDIDACEKRVNKWYDRVIDNGFNLGPRAHVWNDIHHLIGGIGDLLLMAFGVMVYLSWGNWLAILTALFIGWEFMELGYSYGRYRKWIKPIDENVTFADLKVSIPWYEWHDRPEDVPDKLEGICMHHVKGWHWIQILPFHAPSWVMHTVRITMIGGMVLWNVLFAA